MDEHRGQHHAHGHGTAGARAPGGRAEHAGHDVRMFRRRFLVTLALTLPVLAYSEHLRGWVGLHGTPAGADIVNPLLGTVILLYGGWPFLTGAVGEIRARAPGMMLLIGMAIVVAYGASLAGSLGLGDVEVWWRLALLITIMLLGHWMEMRAVGQARGALAALAELLPDTAERVTGDGTTEHVALDDLRVGDVVLVRPGGRVPADGVVIAGRAAMDESMMTGESRPVARATGERVVAATVATDSALRVRVEAVGDDTALAGIRRLVAAAQSSRSRGQRLADRAAALLFWLALTAGAVTFAAWMAVGDPGEAVTRTATVLIIACPHALGLAVPLVIAISTAMAARSGILVTDRAALERMRTVDTVLFDKTGTLTAGAHRVTAVDAADGDADAVLALAGAAEADSEHPLARAIVAAARARGPVPPARGFRALAGRGVRAEVDGAAVAVGGPALLAQEGVGLPHGLTAAVERAQARGASALAVLRDGAAVGVLTLEDAVRPESAAAVADLRAAGLGLAVVTGDERAVAERVAGDLGIDRVFARVLPADKDRVVAGLQDDGRVVAMVGDGVNDAPALTRADVGIAIGAGTDVAIESAGIVLASDDPRGVVSVRRLSAAGHRKMVQNLWWAAGYNIAAIPLAAGVLAPIGFTLPMAVGAVLMSLSTIVVALNAQLLRRVDLRPWTRAAPER